MPDDPLVVRILRDYRQMLDARDSALVNDMGLHWLEIEKNLESDMLALAYEVNKRKEAGTTITEQIVWRQERYKQLQAQIEEQIKQYNQDYATGIITQYQRDNAMLGITAAQDAIHVSFAETGAMGPMWNRLNLNAIESMMGFAGDGSPLYKLLKAAYPDAVNGLLQELINGMARGLNPAETAKNMANGFGMGLERALLIARTETARAYRMGSTEQYRQSGVVSGYKRLVKKETACLACLMLDGQFFTTEEELTDHPRGKCIAVPCVMGINQPTWQTGKEWFNGLPADKQREMMGAKKFDLWQQGKFNLDDLAKMAHSDVWGDSPRVATMAELQ